MNRARHSVKALFRPTKHVPFKGSKKSPDESISANASLAKSHNLLLDQGIIQAASDCPGMFHFLPLGLRSVEKLVKLIDNQLRSIGGQKILMPTLTPSSSWTLTNRLGSMGKEIIQVKDRLGHDLVLSPTHEEAVTSLVASMSSELSHKSLPLKLYQVSSKFRDEMKPRLGLMRSREFIMKDMYTFDLTKEDAEETYQLVRSCYRTIFQALGVPVHEVQGDCGSIGGSKSHELHYLADIGEDSILVCPKCNKGKNVSVDSLPSMDDCQVCLGQERLVPKSGIEVAHLFLLGDKYSKAFKATVSGPDAKSELLQMGCYGIGVSRLIAAATEVMSDGNQLRWPKAIVPYSVAVLGPKGGSKEAKVMESLVYPFYDLVNSDIFADDAILDDRNDLTVGGKLREARKVGYRFVILFGKDSTKGLVEVYDQSRDSMDKMTLEAAKAFLSEHQS